MIGDNEKATKIALSVQKAGFDVRAIRPPTVPVGTARLRISLNINLDEPTLRQFTSVLRKAIDNV